MVAIGAEWRRLVLLFSRPQKLGHLGQVMEPQTGAIVMELIFILDIVHRKTRGVHHFLRPLDPRVESGREAQHSPQSVL
jgi:hypothetical protein